MTSVAMSSVAMSSVANSAIAPTIDASVAADNALAAANVSEDDGDGGREVNCFQCGMGTREFTRTLNSLCDACFTRFGSVDAALYGNEACQERKARLEAKEAAEEQPTKVIAPLTQEEKEAFVYVNHDKHGYLWNELCDKLKAARDCINYPPDFYEQISKGQATRDYERANYPLVAAFEEYGVGSNEHYNLCKALVGTSVGTYREFFPMLHAEGLVDRKGNATQDFKDQVAARMTFKKKNTERELEAAARFAAKEAQEDQRKAAEEVAAAEKVAEEATPKKRKRELPRDSEAPGAPMKRA